MRRALSNVTTFVPGRLSEIGIVLKIVQPISRVEVVGGQNHIQNGHDKHEKDVVTPRTVGHLPSYVASIAAREEHLYGMHYLNLIRRRIKQNGLLVSGQ